MLQSSLLNDESGILARANGNALDGDEVIVPGDESVYYLDGNGQTAEKRTGIHK